MSSTEQPLEKKWHRSREVVDDKRVMINHWHFNLTWQLFMCNILVYSTMRRMAPIFLNLLCLYPSADISHLLGFPPETAEFGIRRAHCLNLQVCLVYAGKEISRNLFIRTA